MSSSTIVNETKLAGAFAKAFAREELEMKEIHSRNIEKSAAQKEGAVSAPSPWRLHSSSGRSGGRFSKETGPCPWQVQKPRERCDVRSEQPGIARDKERVLVEAAS